MIEKFQLEGMVYSTNKANIKKVFKKHGLDWKGTMEKPRWASETESISATFERSEGVTIDAILIFEGPKDSEFFKEFKQYILTLGTKTIQNKLDAAQAKINRELKYFDMVYKPNVKQMKTPVRGLHYGAPEEFIRASMKDYEEKRERFIKERTG